MEVHTGPKNKWCNQKGHTAWSLAKWSECFRLFNPVLWRKGLWFLQHVIGMNQILKYLLIFMTCQLFSQLVITIWREICQYCPKQDCSIQEGICFKRLIIFFQLPIILKFIYFFGFTLLEVYTHDVHIFRIDTQLVMLFLCPTFYSFW